MQPFSFNRQIVLERLGGDEDILGVMIDMFLEDLDTYCNAVMLAWQANDASLTQREAHTVKGLLASFEDIDGTQLAYRLEHDAKAGHLENMEASIVLLQQRLREIAGVLQAQRS